MSDVRLWKVALAGLAIAGLLYGALALRERIFPQPPNLLLISVDTLRADHLGCYNYPRPTSPNIDRLANRGVLLERFVSPRGLTDPALATLLTGLEAHHHKVRYNFQRPEGFLNLATVLGEKGYLCRAYLSNSGDFIRLGFDDQSQGFTNFTQHTRRDRHITRLATKFLIQQNQSSNQPFFLWLHYMSPHRRYRPPEPWDRGLDGKSPQSADYYDVRLEDYMADKADLSDGTLEAIINYYDGCVAFVDSLVAEVLATLEAQGLEENTLVVFTADHGDELYEHHHYFLHQLSMYDGTLQIPLIFRWKGKIARGVRIAEQVGLVHLMPTILDLLGVKLEHPIDGESFRDLLDSYAEGATGSNVPAVRRRWQERPILIEMIREEGCAYGVYRHPYKYIFLEESVGFRSQPAPLSSGRATTLVYPPVQLFDLVADPEETENLAGKQPALQAELHQIVQEKMLDFADCLKDRFPDVSAMPPGQIEALDAELRALGYTGPGSLRQRNPAKDTPPKR